MKRTLVLMVIAVVAFTIYGCDQHKNPATPENSVSEQLPLSLQNAAKLFQQREVEYLAATAGSLAAEKSMNTVQASSDAREIHVPRDYATISAAVDAARPGAKVVVHRKASPYTETVRVRQNNLHIIGEGETTLAGSFIVESSGVRIERFNIDAPSSATAPGIWALSTASNLTIRNNRIRGATESYGIVLNDGNANCRVEKNRIKGITIGILTSTNSDGHTIRGNLCSNNLAGFLVLGSRIKLSDNKAHSNDVGGFAILFGANNRLEGNTANRNGQFGMLFQSVSQSGIGAGNVCNFNGQYGISITGGKDNTVFKNDFHCNGEQDIIDSGTNTRFRDNSTGPLPECK